MSGGFVGPCVGFLFRCYSDPFLKSPTSSFFLVSTEMAGSPAAIAVCTVVLMGVNWASRARRWCPFPGFAIGLAAVAQLTQQQAHQLLANLEAGAEEGSGDLALAAADPAQRRLRIAADRVLNRRLQSREQARPPAPPHACAHRQDGGPVARETGPALQFHDRPPDCAARKPSRRAGRRHTAIARSQGLVRREEAAAPLVKKLDRSPIPRPDVIYIDHFRRIAEPARAASAHACLAPQPATQPDSVIPHRILNGSV